MLLQTLASPLSELHKDKGDELRCWALRPLYVAGQYVENVPSFVYLGSLISPDSRAGPEVERRIVTASRAFGALRCVF